MLFENKFLFLGKVFCIIFIIINLVNIFPINLGDGIYYARNFNTILDTSTLLLLGFSIPKFLFTRKIISLEPYRVNEYYTQKCNLSQAFDIELNQYVLKEEE